MQQADRNPGRVYYKPYEPETTEKPPSEDKDEAKKAPVQAIGYKLLAQTVHQETYEQKAAPKEQLESNDEDYEQVPSTRGPYEFGFTEGSFKIPDFFRNFLSAPPPWIRLKDWRR